MSAIIGKDIEKVSSLLKNGDIVAIPTETVYGLAGNALNEDALLKIYSTKNRPSFDPLIMHLPAFDRINDYVEVVPEVFHRLAEKFCPGPLTFILPKKAIVPDIMTSGLETLAVRIPDHPITLELLKMLPFPLAAPSANLFGRVSPTSALHVKYQIGDKIPYILDGGECRVGIESTIISYQQKKIFVLRQGGVSMEMIQDVCNGIPVLQQSETDGIIVPGQLKSHYATKTPLITGDIDGLLSLFAFKNIALLSFSTFYPQLDAAKQRMLSPAKDLNEAAKNLFRYMYELDELGCELILAEKLPDEGLGRAINDRLQRAAG